MSDKEREIERVEGGRVSDRECERERERECVRVREGESVIER